MSDGIGVFVKMTDKLGSTLQILHNICPHTSRSNHRGDIFIFAYLNDIHSGDVEVVSFQQELLAVTESDKAVTPISMTQILALFANDKNLDLVGPFTAGAASTKNKNNQDQKFHVHPLPVSYI